MARENQLNNKNNLRLILVGVLSGIILFLIPFSVFFTLSLLFFGVCISICVVFYNERENPGLLLKIFILAIGLRLTSTVFLVLVSYFTQGHIFFLGGDTLALNVYTSEILAFWQRHGHPPASDCLLWMIYAGDLTFAYCWANIYYFVGEYPFLPLVVNCLFGGSAVIFLYLITKEIYNYRVAILAALLFTFWPSLILWSSQNLKEPISVFMIMLTFWLVMKLTKKGHRIKYFLLIIISLIIYFKIRFYFAIPLSISLIVYLIPKRKEQILFLILSFLILLMAALLLLKHNFVYLNAIGVIGRLDILQYLNHHHTVKAVEASSAFLMGVDISTPLNFLINSPLFLTYILFSPFPWQINNLLIAFASFEMLIWYSLFFFFVRGIIFTLRYKVKAAFAYVVYILLMVLVFFGEGNVGTLFRHRSLIWPVLFMFIAVGFFPAKEILRLKE